MLVRRVRNWQKRIYVLICDEGLQMRIIEQIYIKKFRGFDDVTIKFNKPVNAIIGKNGAMKTTLLGMLAHPFSLKTGPMATEEPLIGGKLFNSQMSDKFKFSDRFDIEGEHQWSLQVNTQIYPKHVYTCLSERRTDNGKLRFWSTEGREKDMNFIQCPVIYLSMKRLLPMGEEKKLTVNPSELTAAEKQFYAKMHNQILISTETIEDVQDVASANNNNKRTLGPTTATTDAWSISAGQDNVGRIILAVLSMIRLKEKYPQEYRGGIICIDEVESTLYPAAQEKLIEFMYDSAQKYNLQYFFTTHSMSVINFLKTGKYNNRNSITYLQKVGGKIIVTENPSLRDIENNLNVAAGKKEVSSRIKVYCEDSVGVTFCKAFLPKKIKDKVEFVTGMDLPWTVYKTMYQHNVPEFLNNIIVLDGDVKDQNLGWKNYPKNKNITFLPSMFAPERMIYNMLSEMDETDEFWDNSLSGYSKDVCFRDYPNQLTIIDDIKAWFEGQKDNAGKSYSKFLKEWKKRNPEDVEKFVKDFVKTYNYVASKTGFDCIEMDE